MSPDIQAQVAQKQAELAALQARQAQGVIPALGGMPGFQQMMQPQQPFNIEALVKAEVAKLMPQLAPAAAIPWKAVVEGLVRKALPAEDVLWIGDHIKEDMPGALHFLNSESILVLFKMAYEEYREFLRTPPPAPPAPPQSPRID